MKKVKEFYKKHEVTIKVAGCVVGGIVGYNLLKRHFTKNLLDLQGKNIITWDPNQPDAGVMTLERVKEFMDANANTSGGYAIFREGLNPAEYTCIYFDSNTILS